jgi:secreted trypsin-like serine protease
MASPVFSIIVLFITFLATSNGQNCGRSHVASLYSIGSEYASRGQWPWLVPLLTNSDSYFCGSTIVSEKHLITGELITVNAPANGSVDENDLF